MVIEHGFTISRVRILDKDNVYHYKSDFVNIYVSDSSCGFVYSLDNINIDDAMRQVHEILDNINVNICETNVSEIGEYFATINYENETTKDFILSRINNYFSIHVDESNQTSMN